jgi:hypothetical protein
MILRTWSNTIALRIYVSMVIDYGLGIKMEPAATRFQHGYLEGVG